jgi:hypothetical protein
MANLGRGANYKKDASHDGLCTAIIIDRYEKGDEECVMKTVISKVLFYMIRNAASF